MPLDTGVQIGINNVEYYHMAVGWVIIGRLMARIILNEKDAEPGKTYPDLAGIMRNLSQDEERPIITNDFRKDGYKKYVVPQGFDGRANHLLNYINKTGGIDRTLSNSIQSTIFQLASQEMQMISAACSSN
ncbi:MAG: hypothetical protein IPL12_10935 [Bacteroidetes bacterium]|nr:hypothetical protein [Bacteroidota bacterium]